MESKRTFDNVRMVINAGWREFRLNFFSWKFDMFVVLELRDKLRFSRAPLFLVGARPFSCMA